MNSLYKHDSSNLDIALWWSCNLLAAYLAHEYVMELKPWGLSAWSCSWYQRVARCASMACCEQVRLASVAENAFNAVERISEFCDLPQEAPEEIRYTKPDGWPDKGRVSRPRPSIDCLLHRD